MLLPHERGYTEMGEPGWRLRCIAAACNHPTLTRDTVGMENFRLKAGEELLLERAPGDQESIRTRAAPVP